MPGATDLPHMSALSHQASPPLPEPSAALGIQVRLFELKVGP